MEIEKSEYREILFDDINHVNSIASECTVRGILTFRQQEIFGSGLVLLSRGKRVQITTEDRLVQLKKHYERLTMAIAQDFLLFGFSVLLLPSVARKAGGEVRVTSHVDMQAVVVHLKPRTTSSFFSASNLEYLVLDRLTLRPLKNCIVLEHPLWKPHASGRLHSPIDSLLSWWRQYQKELERSDMVAETLSRVNIFYEDMPELYKLTEESYIDKSKLKERNYTAPRFAESPFSRDTRVAGEPDGPLTRDLMNSKNIEKSSAPGLFSYLGHLERGEKTALQVLHQRPP